MSTTPNKTTLIIGGSTGIGLAIAETQVKNGQSVILVARNESRLAKAEHTLREVAAPNVDITVWLADLADWNAVQENLIARIRDLPQDVVVNRLVNSAGVFVPKPFLEHEYKDYDVSLLRISLSKDVHCVCGLLLTNSK